MTALGGEPTITEWEKILQSKLSRSQIRLFINLRTSEAIRAKIKYNSDHPN